jgi:hypothetical protein
VQNEKHIDLLARRTLIKKYGNESGLIMGKAPQEIDNLLHAIKISLVMSFRKESRRTLKKRVMRKRASQ